MSKRIKFFFITLFITFGVVVLTVLQFPKEETEEIEFEMETIKVKEEVDCTSEDTLEYLFYKETDELWEKNNKFGLYVYAENKDFFEIAQNLVNSKGGDWGYVLIPYNVADRDKDKWGRVFEQLQNKHLIPVIQLWDVDTKDYKVQTREAAEFLNSFVWPIKYKYISAYNEMNDYKFWYGQIDPEGYAEILDYTILTFKNENPDFRIMNGAFNVSAMTDNRSLDSFEYMRQMDEAIPGIFNKLDAWASHPYPQPNFSGNPLATGRWSIRAYENELDYLKSNLGVEKDLPVFITETGWAHAEGYNYNFSYYPVETIAEYFKTAFEDVWLPDNRVRAVMPFTIRYDPPFDHFSWINQDNVPYYHYNVVKSISKVEGEPPVLEKGNVQLSNCNN